MTDYVIRIIVNGQDNASGPLGNVSSVLGNMGTIAGGILSAQLFQNIARGIMDMGREALDATASWERMGLAMQSMLAREMVNAGEFGNLTDAMDAAGPKAEEMLGWLERLALASPFDAEGVARAYKMGLTFGFTSEQAKTMTQVLIDMSSGMGLSSFEMDRVAYAIGQINNSDKLLMQDLRQLMNVGVPVNDILKKMGYSISDVGKEAISSKDFVAAFTEEMGTGYAGAAKKQATSWAGLLNSVSDIKKIGLREFFGATFEAIQPLISKFVEKFSDPAFTENIRKWGEPLGEFVQKIVELVGRFDEFKSSVQNSDFLGDLIEMLSPLGDSFERIQKVSDRLAPYLSSIAQYLGDAIAKAARELATNIIPWLVAQFEKFSLWFQENSPLIKKFFEVVSEFIVNTLIPAVVGFWAVVEPILSGVIDILLLLATEIMQIVTGDWEGAWETMNKILTTASTAITKAILAFLDWLARLMGSSMGEISAMWLNNWNMLKQIVVTALSLAASYIMSKIAEIGLGISNWLASIGLKWKNAWNEFINVVQTTWSKVGNIISSKIQSIKDAIYSKLDGFADAGRQIVEGIEQGIKDAWAGLISTFEGLIDLLPDAVKDILGIASPSKVFAEFGRNMMQGWEQGLIKNSSLPIKATLATANAMVSGGNTTTNQWNVNIHHPNQSAGAVRDDIRLLQLAAGV